MSEYKKHSLQDSDLVEWSVFSELVAMDEDEEGFSKSLFQTFVDQVLETFTEIDDNMKIKNLEKLSALGHYLKGSAAALGLTQISEQCERIQNYGNRENFDNFSIDKVILHDIHGIPQNIQQGSDDYWIAFIGDALEKARDGFVRSRAALNEYFDDEL